MTADQLKRMDDAERLVASFARLKDADNIKKLYSEAKSLMES